MHCGLQAGNLCDAGEPPQGFDGRCGGQAVAGAVFGGRAAGGMKVVGEARPGDVKQGAGEGLQPVKEGRDAAQVFAEGGVGEGEQDLVSVAGLCRRVADPKPQLAGIAAGLKKASECGFAGGAPAVCESFGGGCGAQGGQARSGFDRPLRGRLGAGGGDARDLGSACWGGTGRGGEKARLRGVGRAGGGGGPPSGGAPLWACEVEGAGQARAVGLEAGARCWQAGWLVLRATSAGPVWRAVARRKGGCSWASCRGGPAAAAGRAPMCWPWQIEAAAVASGSVAGWARRRPAREARATGPRAGKAASGWKSRATRGKGISPKARQAHGWARPAGWRG